MLFHLDYQTFILLMDLSPSQTGLQSSRGIGRTSEGTDDDCKASRNFKPFLPLLHFSLFFAKKGVFSILWAGPLKNDDFSSIAEKGTYWPI